MLINVSQFYIITHAGPVSSTVVGHLKTILIIGLGWIVKHEAVGHESALGIGLAVLGIIAWALRFRNLSQ
jgi:solute carrier family 35 protein E3